MNRYLEVVCGEEGLDVGAGVVVPVALLRDGPRRGPPLPGRLRAAHAATGRLLLGLVAARRPAPRRLLLLGLAAAPLLNRETHMMWGERSTLKAIEFVVWLDRCRPARVAGGLYRRIVDEWRARTWERGRSSYNGRTGE